MLRLILFTGITPGAQNNKKDKQVFFFHNKLINDVAMPAVFYKNYNSSFGRPLTVNQFAGLTGLKSKTMKIKYKKGNYIFG